MKNGFTLIELLTAVAVASILIGIAVANLRKFNRPSLTAAAQIQAFFKETRARAISQTRAYQAFAASATDIQVRYATKCTSPTTDFVVDPRVRLKLPSGVKILAPTWSVCFNSRGLADSNIQIYLQGNDGLTKHLEVMLGGAVRVLAS